MRTHFWSGAVLALALAFPATALAVAPVNSGALPSVDGPLTGTYSIGQVLGCRKGGWNDPGGPSAYLYSYQWKNNTVNIGGATTDNYLVTSGDAGDNISCRVTAT